MTTSMLSQITFPLFQLPLLAWEEVLKCMSYLEQYKFSSTSEKSFNVMRTFLARYQIPFQLDIEFSDQVVMRLSTKKLGLKIDFKRNEKEICWVKLYTRTLSELFKISEVFLKIEQTPSSSICDILNLMEILNLKIEYSEVALNDEDNLKTFLNSSRNVKTLKLVCHQGFDFDTKTYSQFQFEHLSIPKAHWVTVSHFNQLFIDCKSINLDGCDFKCFHLKSILRRWMKGSRLEQIAITYKGILFRLLFDDIPATPVYKVTIREQVCNYGEGQCYLIQQTNGTQAVVSNYNKMFFLNTKFQL